LIGFSVSGANQATTIRRALELHSDGKLLFNCVQATWNVLETSAGPALQEAHAAGLGVIIKEVLANGRLTRRSTFPKDVRNRALLERKAMRLGASVESMVLRAVLEQPWVDIALTGAATVEQVQASLQAVEIPWYNGLDAELAVLSETPKVYWETRKTLAWN
jgi:aryl-alcohol dehydrogenase-like predicted oxidoreductase